jgi:repressor LexA
MTGGFLTERQKEILDFIQAFRDERGYAPTHREICERFGFSSYGTAYKHLKLLGEKGYLRRDRHQRRGLEVRAGAAPTKPAEELPFLGRIAAGRPIEAVAAAESIAVPALLRGELPREHYVLRVAGDSMIEEGIHDGDWVVVERRERAEPGEMAVALVGDEVTLKRVFPEGETVRLQPANAAMAPIRVSAADLRIQGIVVGLMRRY